MLTEQQELFAQSIVHGMSPAQAANAAGLSSPPQNKDVKNRIAQLKEQMRENLGITKETVLKGFMQAIQMSETSMEMIAGYREIGKMLGYYEPQKIEVNLNTGAVGHLSNDKLIELADMSDIIDGQYHLVDE